MVGTIKVLVVEDHEVVREGLRILIQSDPGLKIIGEAADGLQAVCLARKLRPDVVLMDLVLPRSNGLQATCEICKQVPETRVLVLSAYQDEETVRRVMDAGVKGYLTKHSAADELLTAIHEVSEGRQYYSRRIAAKLRAQLRNALATGNLQRTKPKLTLREREVLELLARGQPNKEIAYNLKVSIKTVEKHRQAVMDKLNLHDIASLTRYAINQGLLAPSPRPPPAASGWP